MIALPPPIGGCNPRGRLNDSIFNHSIPRTDRPDGSYTTFRYQGSETMGVQRMYGAMDQRDRNVTARAARPVSVHLRSYFSVLLHSRNNSRHCSVHGRRILR